MGAARATAGVTRSVHRAVDATTRTAPPPARDVLRTTGRPLDPVTKASFDRRFGHDFGRVRIHVDGPAAESAAQLRAAAYSSGAHVVFAANRYAPASGAGERLLAHELAHVVQAGQAPPIAADGDRTIAGPSAGTPMGAGRDWDPAASTIVSPRDRTERQADRFADRVVAGLPIAERPIPSAGLHRSPEKADEETANSSPPLLAQRLVEWADAGLLDAPLRPSDVAEFPPIQVTPEQAKTLAAPPPALAGAAPALAVGGAATAAAAETGAGAQVAGTAARPALKLIEGGLGAAAPEGGGAVAAGRAATFLRVAAPIATGAAVFLWSRPTASARHDTLNPITGQPYSSDEEYDWVGRLAPAQRDYLRRLNAARRLQPDPSTDDDPDPTAVPAPLPKLEPDPDPELSCLARHVPRRGGNARHDAYATKVTGSAEDYLVAPPPYVGIIYDGRTPATVRVWEVKVGHGWFFNASHARLRDITLAKWDAQKDLGLTIASRCDYVLVWSIPDKWVAQLLNARWQGRPLVLAMKE